MTHDELFCKFLREAAKRYFSNPSDSYSGKQMDFHDDSLFDFRGIPRKADVWDNRRRKERFKDHAGDGLL